MLSTNSESLSHLSADPQHRPSLCQKSCFFSYFFVKNLKKFLIIFSILFTLLCQACSSRCTPPDQTLPKPRSCPPSCLISPVVCSNHWLYRFIPEHRASIRWYECGKWPLWMLFGNDDDGLFGERSGVEGYHACSSSLSQALRWWLRNPLHNFCFYVIGTADYCNSRWIILHWHRKQEPNSRLLIALHGGKPFFSVRWAYNTKRKGEVYIGWRERGNFGIKCHLYAKIKKCDKNI